MEQRNLARVVLWMIGALLSFSAMALSIRFLASHGLNLFEVLTIRSAVGLVILLALLAARPSLRPAVRTSRLKMHVMRNSIHYAAQFCWATSLTMLPLATVFALEFTMPAWTAVLAAWFLHEKLTPSRLGVIVLGLAGVLVILRPGFATINLGAFLTLAAAFGYGVVMIVTKKLTATETTLGIIFWMTVIQLPLSLIGSNPKIFLDLGAVHILPVLALGIGGLTSHICLSNAFRAGDATMVVPIDFLRIPLIAVIGWMFYGESLDIFVFIGALIIVSGVIWNLRAEAAQPH